MSRIAAASLWSTAQVHGQPSTHPLVSRLPTRLCHHPRQQVMTHRTRRAQNSRPGERIGKSPSTSQVMTIPATLRRLKAQAFPEQDGQRKRLGRRSHISVQPRTSLATQHSDSRSCRNAFRTLSAPLRRARRKILREVECQGRLMSQQSAHEMCRLPIPAPQQPSPRTASTPL